MKSSFVDIVITWVDGTSKQFKHNWREIYGEKPIPKSFFSHDEIALNIKSLRRINGNLGKIFIVTDGSVPEIPLSTYTNLPIIFIHHKDFIPLNLLPTFSSHIIESFLHKIPGISDDYIYTNDDCFVSKNLEISHFFEFDAKSKIIFSKVRFDLEVNKGWNIVLKPTLKTLQRFYPNQLFYQNTHVPFLFNRQMSEHVFDLFDISQSLKHSPRRNSNSTLNFRLLYSYFLVEQRKLDISRFPRGTGIRPYQFSSPRDCWSLNMIDQSDFDLLRDKVLKNELPKFINIQSATKPFISDLEEMFVRTNYF